MSNYPKKKDFHFIDNVTTFPFIMDVIAALHCQLQQASLEIEDIQQTISLQSEQITFLTRENDQILTDIKDCDIILNKLKLENAIEKESEENCIIRYETLKEDLMLIEGKLSQLPSRFESITLKLCENSKKVMREINKLLMEAMSQNFWITNIENIDERIAIKRKEFKQKYIEILDSKVKMDEELDSRYQEEQDSYALVLTCIEAMERKNDELRQKLNEKEVSSYHSNNLSPKPSNIVDENYKLSSSENADDPGRSNQSSYYNSSGKVYSGSHLENDRNRHPPVMTYVTRFVTEETIHHDDFVNIGTSSPTHPSSSSTTFQQDLPYFQSNHKNMTLTNSNNYHLPRSNTSTMMNVMSTSSTSYPSKQQSDDQWFRALKRRRFAPELPKQGFVSGRDLLNNMMGEQVEGEGDFQYI